MDWTERLHAAIDYFEANLEHEIEMERAAALANCSLFHFIRMFEVICGTTPGEYVRRRRLSRAALDLAAGDGRVIDLALNYGYESPESFAKAFKRLFGLTPTEARVPGVPLRLFPRMHLTVVLRGERTMQYRIVDKPAFEAVGMTLQTSGVNGDNLKAIPAFWRDQNVNGNVPLLASQMGPLGLLGICYDYDPRTTSLRYLIGIERPATDAGQLPAGSASITIPAAKYAVFESVGPIPQAIQETWRRIFTEWFPDAGYEHAATPELEIYPPHGKDVSAADYVCEVWIPVQKKGT